LEGRITSLRGYFLPREKVYLFPKLGPSTGPLGGGHISPPNFFGRFG